jgi:hypothetical protein
MCLASSLPALHKVTDSVPLFGKPFEPFIRNLPKPALPAPETISPQKGRLCIFRALRVLGALHRLLPHLELPPHAELDAQVALHGVRKRRQEHDDVAKVRYVVHWLHGSERGPEAWGQRVVVRNERADDGEEKDHDDPGGHIVDKPGPCDSGACEQGENERQEPGIEIDEATEDGKGDAGADMAEAHHHWEELEGEGEKGLARQVSIWLAELKSPR